MTLSSPTWAAVTVVPMPALPEDSRERAWMRRLASSMMLAQAVPGVAVGQPGVERLDGHLGRHLAGLGAAHAVGDDEQRGAHEVVVLVALPLQAEVGAVPLFSDPQHQSALEGELAVTDADRVAGVQGLWAAQRFAVQVRAVRRAKILQHHHIPARTEARVV